MAGPVSFGGRPPMPARHVAGVAGIVPRGRREWIMVKQTRRRGGAECRPASKR